MKTKRSILIGFLGLLTAYVWAAEMRSGGASTTVDLTGLHVTPSTITTSNVYTSCMTVTGSSVSFMKGVTLNVSRTANSTGDVSILGQAAANTPNIFSDATNNKVGIGNNSPLVTLDVGNCSGLTFMDGNTGDACFTNDVEIEDNLYVLGTNNILGNSTTTANVIFNARVILPSHATPRTSVTPAFAGAIIRNSTANELCFSTGTTVSTWVRVSTPSLACQN